VNFEKLKSKIKTLSTGRNFSIVSNKLEKEIFSLSRGEVITLIAEIGTIPECIEIDSTEEKLYTKASDILLAKALQEMGLKAQVFKERSGVADIFAKSCFHNYTLIGDAKTFRLSRTAKNQKDFKVESMTHWTDNSDYSVLCCPYFQYPHSKSQIYNQALNGNVLLFS
jgi:type II restriction enzyme